MSGRVARRPPKDSDTDTSSDESEEAGPSHGNKRASTASSVAVTPSSTQRPSQQINTEYTADDERKMAADVVFAILTLEARRAPLKKSDISKLSGLTGKPSPIVARVFKRAFDTLLRVFGIEMSEMLEKRGTYILVNKISQNVEEENHHMYFSDKENAHMGLLFTVLGLIFMSNDVVSDKTLFGFMRQLGVFDPEEDTPTSAKKGDRSSLSTSKPRPDIHHVFGKVKDLVFKEWGQRQQYLDIKKIDGPNPDEPEIEIRWGPRACKELKKSHVLNMISHLYGCSPEQFRTQFSKVQQEEGQEAMDVN